MSLRLDPADLAGLADYLRAQGWLADGEAPVSVQRAGEGNMNLALRLTTDRRGLIVKQGRPWVEKYPDIPAPEDRTLVEAEWYALAGEVDELAAARPSSTSACCSPPPAALTAPWHRASPASRSSAGCLASRSCRCGPTSPGREALPERGRALVLG